MICLRCGYCCRWTFTVKVVVDPAKGYIESNLAERVGSFKRKSNPCPHLRGSEMRHFSCAVHDEPWYKRTKCFEFAQRENSLNTPCRVGAYVLTHPRRRPLDWRLVYYLVGWKPTENSEARESYDAYAKWFER